MVVRRTRDKRQYTCRVVWARVYVRWPLNCQVTLPPSTEYPCGGRWRAQAREAEEEGEAVHTAALGRAATADSVAGVPTVGKHNSCTSMTAAPSHRQNCAWNGNVTLRGCMVVWWCC